MGTKTRQCIYRKEGSSIKQTFKITVWLTVVTQPQIYDDSNAWRTNTMNAGKINSRSKPN